VFQLRDFGVDLLGPDQRVEVSVRGLVGARLRRRDRLIAAALLRGCGDGDESRERREENGGERAGAQPGANPPRTVLSARAVQKDAPSSMPWAR
jgi:hypothetical protein